MRASYSRFEKEEKRRTISFFSQRLSVSSQVKLLLESQSCLFKLHGRNATESWVNALCLVGGPGLLLFFCPLSFLQACSCEVATAVLAHTWGTFSLLSVVAIAVTLSNVTYRWWPSCFGRWWPSCFGRWWPSCFGDFGQVVAHDWPSGPLVTLCREVSIICMFLFVVAHCFDHVMFSCSIVGGLVHGMCDGGPDLVMTLVTIAWFSLLCLYFWWPFFAS